METSRRLLTLNCHEAWVHQLGYLGYEVDIIDGLPGRYCSRWNTGVRPLPKRARLVHLEEILDLKPSYDCMIAHNLTDLLDLKTLPGPRILVIHNSLDGLVRQYGLGITPHQLKGMVHDYLGMVGGHGVAVSLLKGRSWEVVEDIVEFGVDVQQYLPWSGEAAAGVRVSNQISNRKEVLLWDFHEAAFKDLPVQIVGFNPDMPTVMPSKNWDDLKSILSSHRFYIHTAHPALEDGYNMASLEAMAAGLPVLGNRHPSSPVEHGISGFVSDDPEELRKYALLLLQNRERAGRMGEAARKKVTECFSAEKFVSRFNNSIRLAREKWEGRRLSDAYFSLTISGDHEKVQFLARSGIFIRLADQFENELRAMHIEEGIEVLDDIMKHLGMPRDRIISSLEDLTQMVIEVSDRLRGLQENRAAESLLKAALIVTPVEKKTVGYFHCP